MHQSIHHNILDNPIQHRENIVLKRQRGKWFWRIMYAITALLMLIPVIWGTGKYFYESVGISLSLLVIANVIVFVLVVIRAVANTSDSLYRERRSKTWELLMLTGVSNWRVVFGKWIGVMRHLVRDFTWLYVIRVGTSFWFVVYTNLNNDYGWRELSSSRDSAVRLLDIRFDDHYFIIALFLLLLFTILELMLSSSIGLATAFFQFKAKTSTAIAIAVRVGIAILLPAITILLPAITYLSIANMDNNDNLFLNLNYDYIDANEELLLVAFRTTTIFADNGALSIIVFTEDSARSITSIYQAVSVATALGVVLYLLFTGIALSVAGNRAYVRGLDFERGMAQKMKRKRPMPVENPITATDNIRENIVLIQSDDTNVFKIDNADNLSVEIYHYQRRLGRMILRITGDNLPQYIQLSSVAYVEAPAFWKGASFSTASDTECEQFIKEKGIFVNSLTKDSIRLYVLDGKNRVRILAGTAQILEALPETV